MQVKDAFLLSKKQLEDEKIAEINLKYDLKAWFNKVCTIILSNLNEDKEKNDIKFLFQVEQIINEHKQEYMDILTENIHDYYVTTSENKEAIINNTVAQKTVDNTLFFQATKDDEQFNLDDYLYDETTSKNLTEQIKKKLRFNNNIQISLNRYLNNYHIHGLEYDVVDLLEHEIDEAVVEYMSTNVFTATESTLSRVTQDIYDIIIESYAEQGEGINKVTELIQEKFSELSEYEAERIARTETLKAQSSATHNRLVSNPNVEYIQWVATDDERVRDSHAEVDGEITFADGTGIFSNGLRYPGDTNGDIEEWINCRCDEVAYIPEAGYIPPDGATSWTEDEMVLDSTLNIPDVYVELDEYLASWW